MSIFKKTFTVEVISDHEIPDCLQVGQIEYLVNNDNTFLRLSSGTLEKVENDQALELIEEFGLTPEDFNN